MYKNKLNIFLFAVLGIFLYNVLPNIYDNHKKIKVLQQEKEELLLKNRNMEKKLTDTKKEIERLSDEFYVETLSRERLNMVKEDEKIYRLVN